MIAATRYLDVSISRRQMQTIRRERGFPREKLAGDRAEREAANRATRKDRTRGKDSHCIFTNRRKYAMPHKRINAITRRSASSTFHAFRMPALLGSFTRRAPFLFAPLVVSSLLRAASGLLSFHDAKRTRTRMRRANRYESPVALPQLLRGLARGGGARIAEKLQRPRPRRLRFSRARPIPRDDIFQTHPNSAQLPRISERDWRRTRYKKRRSHGARFHRASYLANIPARSFLSRG